MGVDRGVGVEGIREVSFSTFLSFKSFNFRSRGFTWG